MRNSKDTASGRQQTLARERREWVKPTFGRIELASAQGAGPDPGKDGATSA